MTTDLNQKETKPKEKISSRGGVRPGAGRPKGAKDRVTVSGILDALETRTGGQSYEDILIEDFLNSRLNGDSQLTHKYHTLLSNKFIANLNEITVEEVGDMIEAKKVAFREAILALNINNVEDNTNATD
jgi:hypothetical protein